MIKQIFLLLLLLPVINATKTSCPSTTSVTVSEMKLNGCWLDMTIISQTNMSVGKYRLWHEWNNCGLEQLFWYEDNGITRIHFYQPSERNRTMLVGFMDVKTKGFKIENFQSWENQAQLTYTIQQLHTKRIFKMLHNQSKLHYVGLGGLNEVTTEMNFSIGDEIR